MKLKFLLYSFLLIIGRGCDFYSTSLWYFQDGGHLYETNPISSILGMGWTALVAVNVIVIAFVLYGYYYYTYKYQIKYYSNPPKQLTAYVSDIYYGVPDKFYQILFRVPKNRKVAISHFGYIAIRLLIISSFIATLHNLGQFYNFPLYLHFKSLIGSPIIFYYSCLGVGGFMITYYLWSKEHLFVKSQT